MDKSTLKYRGGIMPIKIRKVKNRNCYRVSDPKHIHAKCTSLKKAKAQKRIIESIPKK